MCWMQFLDVWLEPSKKSLLTVCHFCSRRSIIIFFLFHCFLRYQKKMLPRTLLFQLAQRHLIQKPEFVNVPARLLEGKLHKTQTTKRIVRCLMPLLRLYFCGQCAYPCFPGVFCHHSAQYFIKAAGCFPTYR